MDRVPTRRRVLRDTLWLASLSAFGVLPAGCGSKWALLPPRPVDWVMKPLSSAKVEERVLSDGRVQLHIAHELLAGVTPEMLLWWWGNIDGTMELNGRSYARYLIWHPIDHIHFAALDRQPDGSVGVGSRFHIVEALGADMKNLVDVMARLVKLDATGARIEVGMFGGTALSIDGEFGAQPDGTQIATTMTIGTAGWLSGLNSLLIDWLFPRERQQAWIKHSVEEIGNLQFFLPELYRRNA
jgi:hypothetical protein